MKELSVNVKVLKNVSRVTWNEILESDPDTMSYNDYVDIGDNVLYVSASDDLKHLFIDFKEEDLDDDGYYYDVEYLREKYTVYFEEGGSL